MCINEVQIPCFRMKFLSRLRFMVTAYVLLFCLVFFCFLSSVIKNSQNTSLAIQAAKTSKWQSWNEKEFNEKVSCGLTGIPHTVQAGLQVTVSLFLPPQCWVLETQTTKYYARKLLQKYFRDPFLCLLGWISQESVNLNVPRFL